MKTNIFQLCIKGSNRNKLIKKLIYYSNAFAIYNQNKEFRIWERSLYGNKNLYNDIKTFLKNTEQSYRKLIIFEPSDVFMGLYKLAKQEKQESFVRTLSCMFGIDYKYLKNNVFLVFKEPEINLRDSSTVKQKIKESAFSPKFCYYELEEYKVKNCFTLQIT